MQQYKVTKLSISEKAKAERIFMHYSLLLASLLTLSGLTLIILGLGDHLDIVVKTGGGFETRLINSSPGFGALALGGIVFAWSKPRRLRANVSHSEETFSQEEIITIIQEKIRKTIQASLESRKLLSHYQLEEIIKTLNERLDAIKSTRQNDGLHISVDPEIDTERKQKVADRLSEDGIEHSPLKAKTSGSANLLYQRSAPESNVEPEEE